MDKTALLKQSFISKMTAAAREMTVDRRFSGESYNIGTLHLLAKLISRSYCAVDTPWNLWRVCGDVEIERQRLE